MKASDLLNVTKLEKNISDKAIETLSDNEKIKRYSNIDAVEKIFLHRILTANELAWKNKKITKLINDYLELSLSVDMKGINSIVDLYKSEIEVEKEKIED